MPNPFQHNRPVKPADFVGRWPLVRKIADDLVRPGGDSYAIVGGRRFGKSSLLLALQHQLVERLTAAQRGHLYVLPLVIDFKGLALDSHHRLFAQVVAELRRVTRQRRSPRHRGPHLPLELDDARLDRIYPLDRPPDSLNAFKEVINEVIDCAFNTYGELRLVLLIDEIEEALERPWTEELFNQLRSLIYSGTLVEWLRLVIAGDDRVLKMRSRGSPLLNMLEPEYLAVMQEADSQQIIARAESVPSAIADAVVRQSGGHPYLTQSLMHQLWEEGVSGATPDQLRAVVHRLCVERRPILQNWYNAIGPDGQATYAALVDTDPEDWLSAREIAERVTTGEISVTQGLINLCYHGFATHDGSWRRYRRTGDFFRDWFSEEYQREGNTGIVDRQRLFNRLMVGFDLPELDSLIFELGLRPDDVAGDTIATKARNLVLYFERRDQLGDLKAAVDRARPE